MEYPLWLAPGLAHKKYDLSGIKHSSLFGPLASDEKIITLTSGQMLYNLKFTTVHNKLECLLLASRFSFSLPELEHPQG